jgi:hypothetical protein
MPSPAKAQSKDIAALKVNRPGFVGGLNF